MTKKEFARFVYKYELTQDQMILFSKPCDQNRFNATLYELLRMNFCGDVLVDGIWDPFDTLTYLENRMRIEVMCTLRMDGSLFRFGNKYVLFACDSVLVTTSNLSCKNGLESTVSDLQLQGAHIVDGGAV